MPVILDATVGAVRQTRTWDCSAAALAWLFNAAGQGTSESDAIAMLGSYVNPDVGLTDSSGAGLADTLRGAGLDATNGSLSFDSALARVGSGPFIMGGAVYNHWTGVRSGSGDSLSLANPAPGWMGVGDSMSRDQFNALGPFYGVWITGASAVATAGGPVFAGGNPVAGILAWVRVNPILAGGIAAAVYLLAR